MLSFLSEHRLYLTAAAVSFLACLMLTPLVRRIALRLNIVDSPDARRKLHTSATPLGGGVALLFSFFVASAVVLALSSSQQAQLGGDLRFTIGLVAASLLICILGLIDDRFGLRGRQKLMGQLTAAGILIASGLVIAEIELFGFHFNLGLLAIPFTCFWILGAINALNLIDGVDGLATAVGIVLSLAIAALAMMTGHRTEAFLALAMAGALVSFLIYNSPPASIFLGDAGSMLIGLVLGALAIRGSIKGPATVALVAPTAIWAIPILDVAMAILRRKLTGRSIYTTDRGHLHHTLQRRGFSGRRTVVIIGILCSVTAVAAVTSEFLNNEILATGSVAAVCGLLVVGQVFGHNECLLLLRRLKHFTISLIPLVSPVPGQSEKMETRLQGDHEWDELWETLTQFADRFDLSAIQLNVHLPAINEDYHATWRRRDVADDAEVWHSDIPLVAENTTIGRLKITGACNNGSVCTWMGDLIAGLKPFETQMLELVAEATNGNGNGKGHGARSGEQGAWSGEQGAESREQ